MKKPVMFFILAGFAAVLASMVVYSALKKKEAEVEQAMLKTVEIAVAARDLGLGSKLEAGAMRMARWPRDALPAGAVTEPRAVVGQTVKVGFVENEPIVAAKLFAGEKTAGVLPLLIPPGLRAMSVPVDEVSDIAGFVLPHAKVDVLVALSERGSSGGGGRSKIVLENIEVLAVAQTIEQDKDEPKVVKVVTLLVTPEEAERLTLASHEGALRLALRNYTDSKIVMTAGAEVADMLKAYSNRPLLLPHVQQALHHPSHPLIRPPRPVEVEVMRNGQSREAIEFVNGSAAHGHHDAEPVAPAPAAGAAAPKEAKAAAAPGVAAVAKARAEQALPEAGFTGPFAKTIEVH